MIVGFTGTQRGMTETQRSVVHALLACLPVVTFHHGDCIGADAEAENRYLGKHSWDEYAAWHLGLTDGANDGTKTRYAFVFGDFRRVHRSGIIACHFRAAEWRHKAIELAAHDLLQELDRAAGIG